MNGIMNPEPSVSGGRGPPPPMATQGPNMVPPSVSRGGNNYFGSNNVPEYGNRNMNDGIDISETYASPNEGERSRRQQRAEMKGPSDISDILSGLKTKTINIQEPSSSELTSNVNIDNNASTISISDLKEMQADGNMPRKSKRRQKSDKNTLSLDI
jgi:hypothetical protein